MLEKYIQNPEDPKINFDVGLWYEQNDQLAAAFSFYLRTAERSQDNDLTYQSLLRAASCIHESGDHKEVVQDLVEHAKSSKRELIDIVLQGQYTEYTDEIIDYYLDLPFVNQIIVSCWQTDKSSIDKERVSYVRNLIPEVHGTGNRNLQIVSSLTGILKSTTKYCVKIRSDQKYYHQSLTGMYDFFFKNKERVITFQNDESKPRNRILVGGVFPEFPFHPKDHIIWGNKEDLIDLFSLPLENHSLYTRAGIQSKDYWKYYKHIIRTESYIGSFYCANFDERIRLFLLNPEKYLYDESENRDQSMSLSEWLMPKIFKSFPKEFNHLEWPKYGWTEYPFEKQYNEFGERWHENGM